MVGFPNLLNVETELIPPIGIADSLLLSTSVWLVLFVKFVKFLKFVKFVIFVWALGALT